MKRNIGIRKAPEQRCPRRYLEQKAEAHQVSESGAKDSRRDGPGKTHYRYRRAAEKKSALEREEK